MTEITKTIFIQSSFYIIFFLIIVAQTQCFLVAKKLDYKFTFRSRPQLYGLVSSLFLTVICFVSVPPNFRVLSDETNLLSVSQSMLQDGTVNQSLMGFKYYGNLHSIVQGVPNRPLLFPFLTFLLHVLTGYHYENAFILNGIFLFLCLLGIDLVVRKFGDGFTALAAQLLFLSHPIVVLSATSAGFETANLFFFLSTLTALFFFVKEPGPEKFSLFWISLLLFFPL